MKWRIWWQKAIKKSPCWGKMSTHTVLRDRQEKWLPSRCCSEQWPKPLRGVRIRFTTSHPKDMSDETLEVIAQVPNVCKHIHLPVQSGSSRILKLMNRKYTREWYLDRVAAIKRIIPDCGLTTDIFSGFHSETEEDHAMSLSLMEACGYDAASC